MIISKDTLFVYALKAYDNPTCKTIEEFEKDLDIFTSVVKLCGKEISEENTTRMLNLIVTVFNVFKREVAIQILFYKVSEELWYKLKTVLTFLNAMPEEIFISKSPTKLIKILDSDIPLCTEMITTLRAI